MTRIFQAVWLILGLAWAPSAAADPTLKDLAARPGERWEKLGNNSIVI